MVSECLPELVFGKIRDINVYIAHDVLPVRRYNRTVVFDAFDRGLEGNSPFLPTNYQTDGQMQVGMGSACLKGTSKFLQRKRYIVLYHETSRELYEKELNSCYCSKHGSTEHFVELDSARCWLASRKVA
jgi:hypothetical protein